MRPALIAGLIVAAAPVAGFAQSSPYIAVVTDAEVKLRAGPSDKFPETGSLAKGLPILVDHEETNGWLAVQDPPGKLYSISWVQMQFVEFVTTKPVTQSVVVTDDTVLRPGQLGSTEPLTQIQRTTIPAGTALTVIGPIAKFEGKSWYPVIPPVGDFRYLPKQSVKFEKPANNNFTVRDTSPSPTVPGVSPAGATIPVAAIPGAGGSTLPATSVGKSSVDNPLWAQAEAAERDGRTDEAERLYFQLARQMNEPGGNHDIANLCYTRIHTLREKKRSSTSSTASATRPATTGTQTSGGSLPPAVDAKDDRPQWSVPGLLKRSSITPVEGRQTYALESNGATVLYVVPVQGLDLTRYVGKPVQIKVYGVSYTRPGLTKPYIVATTADLAQ